MTERAGRVSGVDLSRGAHIAGAYNVPLDLLREHRDEIIKHLDPKPGSRYSPAESQYVIPDVYIIKTDEGRSIIEIPLTIGIVGAALLPMFAAVGAIAARHWRAIGRELPPAILEEEPGFMRRLESTLRLDVDLRCRRRIARAYRERS